MAYQYITYSLEENIATVGLNNPPVNALSMPLLLELNDAVNATIKGAAAKALIITGSGLFFAAGADIKEIAAIKSHKEAEEATQKGHSLFYKIESMNIPVIAAINGFCLGGGNELAMACHIRLASDRAKFGQPEINLGIIPGFGGTQRLPRLTGPAIALEMLLSGDMITAQQAQSVGLINKIVPEGEVLKQAKGLAKKITSKGKVAIASIMEAVRDGMKLKLEDALLLESKLFGKICETEDMKEGLSAFIEKRQPQFKDR